MRIPAFGDRVRILATPCTTRIGLAGKVGFVCGCTTPSVIGVEVLGPAIGDRALNIRIEGDDQTCWLPVNAVELVDQGEGTTVRIGRKNVIRGRNGAWRSFKPN